MNTAVTARPHAATTGATVTDLGAYRRRATYYAMASIVRGRRAHPSWEGEATEPSAAANAAARVARAVDSSTSVTE